MYYHESRLQESDPAASVEIELTVGTITRGIEVYCSFQLSCNFNGTLFHGHSKFNMDLDRSTIFTLTVSAVQDEVSLCETSS